MSCEIKRKIFHICFGLIFPFIIYFFNSDSTKIIVSIILIIVSIAEILRLAFCFINTLFQFFFKQFMRDSEAVEPAGTVYFISGVLIIICLFPKSVAILSLVPLIFGDSVASLIGKKFGRIKISGTKTLEGTLSFFCTTLIISLIINYNLFDANFSLTILFFTAIVSSIAELIFRGNKDNFFIPLISAIVLSCGR
ncbi:MAG: hypothetical protein AB1765_09920 [Candidatus Hydrogenedentota bacterium]